MGAMRRHPPVAGHTGGKVVAGGRCLKQGANMGTPDMRKKGQGETAGGREGGSEKGWDDDGGAKERANDARSLVGFERAF